LCFAGPFGILIYKLITSGQSLNELHAQGYDLILLGLCFVQIFIRSFIIGAKYATYSEKQYRMINE
jgi:hypothetical protein